jgi:hypothetical protein
MEGATPQMSAENQVRRRILLEYRRAHEENKDMPFLHTRQHLAERLGATYEELAPHVKWLEQNRYLHWKAADVFKISPKGLRVTHGDDELAREFPV